MDEELKQAPTFEESVENAWNEYKNGEVISGSDLIDVYSRI